MWCVLEPNCRGGRVGTLYSSWHNRISDARAIASIGSSAVKPELPQRAGHYASYQGHWGTSRSPRLVLSLTPQLHAFSSNCLCGLTETLTWPAHESIGYGFLSENAK